MFLRQCSYLAAWKADAL